jgi:hypothetical protein
MASIANLPEMTRRTLFSKRWIAWIPVGSWVKGKGHRVSFVFENHPGHFPNGDTPEGGTTEPWWWGNKTDEGKSYDLACETARQYNEKRGITGAEEAKILLSSMKFSLERDERRLDA